MTDLAIRLNHQQRQVADSVIISMCRGEHEAALQTIENSNEMNTPVQESILRGILRRLLNPISDLEKPGFAQANEPSSP